MDKIEYFLKSKDKALNNLKKAKKYKKLDGDIEKIGLMMTGTPLDQF